MTFEPEDPYVTWTELHGGITYVYAVARNWHCPLSHVWGLVTGGEKERFETLHSYTLPFARRQGLRTLINDVIFDKLKVDVITSGDGTGEGGLGFMNSYGYQLHDPTGTWYVTKKMWKRGEEVDE